MNFKSRTALAEHFKQLEKEGWITSSWLSTFITENDEPKTRLQKVFKINFANVNSTSQKNTKVMDK